MDSVTWTGIGMVLAIVFASLGAAHYAMWIFSKARRERTAKQGSWLPDLIANVVDDFRHVLAAAFLVIFAVVLVIGLVKGAYQQAVSSFGPLMGAIIGYYFGEGRRAGRGRDPQTGSADQRDAGDDIQHARPIEEDEVR